MIIYVYKTTWDDTLFFINADAYDLMPVLMI